MHRYNHIKAEDEAVFVACFGEAERQARGLELIPSENYVSAAVREAMASDFTNKYAEGYPGKRYYGGQEYTDIVETIATDRAKELFGAAFVNVQPLSGAAANFAAFFALAKPGDTILGMDLAHGGHLTHGHPATILAKLFNFVPYGMSNIETGAIDYEALRQLAHTHKPTILLAGFSAYSRELDYEQLVSIAREVEAYAVADVAHIAGLIAGEALKNPFDYGFDVMTTTTHKTLRGPRGGMILTREREDLAKAIDKAVFPGLQGGPHMNLVAGKAVAFGEALTLEYRDYAAQVLKNAKAMEAVFTDAGVRLIGGGTDNHLLLADVATSFGLGGGEVQEYLDSIGITLNKNIIAGDTRTAMNPSGVRFGTPAITTRGMKEAEAALIASIMVAALQDATVGNDTDTLRHQVEELAAAFPVPE
jgi:glycine hydroxymethyltransferase